MKPTVSIIIVNWNGRKQLQECLPGLAKQTYKNFEIIVVDNNSSDDSIEFLSSKYSSVIIKKCSKNFGFAKGCNIGLSKARGKYILLLNNDTIVTRNFLSTLVSALKKNKHVAVVQPKIIFSETGKLQSGATFMTYSGFLYHYGYGKNPKNTKYNHEMDIFSANGSCMLIRREAIKKTGGLFDPDYFAYFEETDFCWRVLLSGSSIRYIPSAVVFHKGAQTSRLLSSSFITFHSFKNRITTLMKNLDTVHLLFIFPIHLTICLLFASYSLVALRMKVFSGIVKALIWSVYNIKATLQKRTKVQKIANNSSFRLKSLIRNQRLNYYYCLFKGLEYYKD